ncbi:hypothetical protein DFQ29_009394 [Apophysomyces sp. BC1021]|nr:hypothetical protein DFQ29_009394 [Apophysomyces sp. BC1021]
MRRLVVRVRYLRMREIANRLQQHQEKSVIMIQSFVRTYHIRQQILRQKAFVVRFQAGMSALPGVFLLKNNFLIYASTIQQLKFRGFSVDGWPKRKYLKDLRSEARSASHLKEMLYKLENKVVEHTQNLTYQKEDKAQLQAKTTKLEA